MDEKDAPEKPSQFKKLMTWVGSASALIGLFASLAGGYHWLMNRRAEQAQLKSEMAVADGQAKLEEYSSAVADYDEILKAHPLYAPALDGQLNVVMAWDENYHALGREGHDPSEVAAPELEKMIGLLEEIGRAHV